jgi:hypothetical protein
MLLPFVLVAGLAALAFAASAGAASSYCSPTGDYCTSAQRQSGAVYLRLSAFSNIGTIRICVTDPKAKRTCRSFALVKRGTMWQVSVPWRSRYPSAGRGRYRVGFFLGRTRLGPLLDFRIR